MWSIRDNCHVLWVARCGLDWRQVKKDRLQPHGGLQLFQSHQNYWCFKLWIASSFNMANVIRFGRHSAKVTIYNSVCTQLSSQSCISFRPKTVSWCLYSQAFLSSINHAHYWLVGWLFPQYQTFSTPVLMFRIWPIQKMHGDKYKNKIVAGSRDDSTKKPCKQG